MTTIKSVFMVYQIMLDLGMSLASLYMALAITDQYGWSSPRERMQLLHRAAFVAVVLGLAWHAVDIMMRPGEHGLTFSNVFLHTGWSLCMWVAAVRISRQQTREARNPLEHRKHTNGDILAGPFPHHNGHNGR